MRREIKEPRYVCLFWFSGVAVFGEHQNHIIGDFLKFNCE